MLDRETGKTTEEIPLPVGGDLAGPEVWRQSVYGSPESIQLGLTLLCSLKRGEDIFAYPKDIPTLRNEVTSLLEILGDNLTVQHRLGNILRACDIAEANEAVVWIA